MQNNTQVAFVPCCLFISILAFLVLRSSRLTTADRRWNVLEMECYTLIYLNMQCPSTPSLATLLRRYFDVSWSRPFASHTEVPIIQMCTPDDQARSSYLCFLSIPTSLSSCSRGRPGCCPLCLRNGPLIKERPLDERSLVNHDGLISLTVVTSFCEGKPSPGW